jgi:hypothetical protein
VHVKTRTILSNGVQKFIYLFQMEKLMSGFGISGMLGADKTKKPGESSPVKPTVENKTPAQPAKVSLRT